MSNENPIGDYLAHDLDAQPGDPETPLPFFDKLLFEHLRSMEGNGLRVDEMKQNSSIGKLYIVTYENS